MFKKIKQKWQIKSNFQLGVIFIVFAINGSLSAKIGSFLLSFFKIYNQNLGAFWNFVLLLIIVLPIYPFLLIGIGFLCGQSCFFVPFAKKMLRKMFFLKV